MANGNAHHKLEPGFDHRTAGGGGGVAAAAAAAVAAAAIATDNRRSAADGSDDHSSPVMGSSAKSAANGMAHANSKLRGRPIPIVNPNRLRETASHTQQR